MIDDDVIKSALAKWGLNEAEYRFVAARENHIYRISTSGQDYALRFHRKGYRTDAELSSELAWISYLRKNGLTVPTAYPHKDGELLCTIAEYQIDLISWLEGAVMDALLPDADQRARHAYFLSLGQEMARFHDLCDDWQPSGEFTRPSWDHDGLVGKNPLWDRFWENAELSATETQTLTQFRETASHELKSCRTFDYGLIHADLLASNVLIHDDKAVMIDFDDGGFGYRLFDIATSLFKHDEAADFGALKEALLQGYKTRRPVDETYLDLFLALRAVTYIGWNITRMNEPDGKARNRRFIDRAMRLIAAL